LKKLIFDFSFAKKDNSIESKKKKKQKYDWNEFKIRDKDFYGKQGS
jgi:hypothetical protein